MVLGPFGKKESDKSAIESNIETYLHNLNLTVASSFSKIKSDLKIAKDHISFLHNKKSQHDQKIQELEQNINDLTKIIASLQHTISNLIDTKANTKEKSPQQTQQHPQHQQQEQFTNFPPPFPKFDHFNNLTQTQKSIFIAMDHLTKEFKQNWIPTKLLAQQLYPHKDYSKVRSTISEYLTLLESLNLIIKVRKGKYAYAAFTQLGQKTLLNLKKEKSKFTKLEKIQNF